MQPFDCLDRNTSIRGTHFLEASAGTGKTFTIEHMVARLILENEDPLELEQILIVTFTKASANDLKQRIKENLEKLSACCKNQMLAENATAVVFDYLKPLFEDKQELRSVINKVEETITLFDRAQIYTIHGFCFAMLKEFAFEADYILNQNEQEAVISPYSLKQMARDYLLHRINPEIYHPLQIELLLNHFKGLENFASSLCSSMFNENMAGINSFKEEYKNFSDQLKSLSDQHIKHLNGLLNDFEKIYPNYKKGKLSFDQCIKQITLISKALENKRISLEEFSMLMDSKQFVTDIFEESNLKKHAKLCINDVQSFSLIEFIISNLKPIYSNVRSITVLMNRLRKDFSIFLKEELEKLECFTYDDLLSKMSQTLIKPLFVKKIREKYKAVIIDEFQDTDPIQWHIFKTLFLQHVVAFCVVGDPKQSIYSFRQADIYTYLSALHALGKENKAILKRNFRSSSALIAAFNELFSLNQAKWLYLPKLETFLPYTPVEAASQEPFLADDGKKAMHFLAIEQELSQSALEKEYLFPKILQEILILRDQIPLDKMAILVKDRYQSKRIMDFLQAFHLPFQAKSRHNLVDGEVFLRMQELFDAVISLEDNNKIKIALLGPFIRLHLLEVAAISDEILLSVKEKFFKLREELINGSLPGFFQSLFTTCFLNNRVTALQNAKMFPDPFFYRDFIQLVELMLDEHNELAFSITEWRDFFDKLIELTDLEDERTKRKTLSEDNGIQIITTHMSKGLEFDIVFALGVSTSSNPKEITDEIVLADLQAEMLRQFYVALTRAKYRVYIPIYPSKSKSTSATEYFFKMVMQTAQQSDALFNQEIALLNSLKHSSYEVLVNQPLVDYVDHDKEKPLELVEFENISKQGCQYIQSFSSIHTSGFEEVMKKQKESEFSSLILPPSKETGILLHQVLEKVFSHPISEKKLSEIFEEIIERELLNTALEPQTSVVKTMVHRLLKLHLILDNESICFDQIDRTKILTEVEFMYLLKNNDLMKGYIDLVFQYKNKIYIVDWKTNWLGDEEKDYQKQFLLLTMNQQQYFLQAAIYSEAFRKQFVGPSFNNCFGGIFYIFLRGLKQDPANSSGVYSFFPEKSELCLV